MINKLITLVLCLMLSSHSFAQEAVEDIESQKGSEISESKTEGLPPKLEEQTEELLESSVREDVLVEEKESKSKAVFLGHLLTPTTYVPEARTVTAGTHVVGYSVNDNLLVGTSSFLYLFYNSPNIYVKYARDISKKQKWAVQLNYLDSDESFSPFNTQYFMEAAMGWLSYSYEVTPFYTFHTSFSYMYFFNEGKPHSLRREPFNDDPFQFSLTTLHDVRVSEHFGLASEIGVLGINYEIPNLHGAVSFRYTAKNYFIQIGVSFDAHVFDGGFDTQEYISNNETLDASHTDEFVIHPEAAFQFFF